MNRMRVTFYANDALDGVIVDSDWQPRAGQSAKDVVDGIVADAKRGGAGILTVEMHDMHIVAEDARA